jgi:hypothetical protein
MVCPLKLFNPKGIFGFAQKKVVDACSHASPATLPSGGKCGWFRQL